MDSLRGINHPNIAKTTQIIDNNLFLYILQEGTELGNLKEHMFAVDGYTEQHIVSMIKQLL